MAKQLIRKGEVAVEVPDSEVLMAENSQIHQLLAGSFIPPSQANN